MPAAGKSHAGILMQNPLGKRNKRGCFIYFSADGGYHPLGFNSNIKSNTQERIASHKEHQNKQCSRTF